LSSDLILGISGDYNIARLTTSQALTRQRARFTLLSERLGTVPLTNHFIARTGLPELRERYLPTTTKRCLLLRWSVRGCEPRYRESPQVLARERSGLALKDGEPLNERRSAAL
jgi:hypothetical protein